MSVSRELKLLHIGKFNFPIPWESWYSKVEEVLNCKIQLEVREQLTDDLMQFKGFNAIRIESSWTHEAFQLFSAVPTFVSILESIDFIYLKENGLWPDLIFREGLHSVILSMHPSLNIKGAGLIVGISKEAIQAALVLIELGISQVTFVVEDETQGNSIKKLLNQFFFKIRIDAITKEKVILLPGVYSILICCENLQDKQELLTSILYFNYLDKNGLVVNAAITSDKKPLIIEAKAIGSKTIDLSDLQFHQEIKALQKVIPISSNLLSKLMFTVTKPAFGTVKLDKDPR